MILERTLSNELKEALQKGGQGKAILFCGAGASLDSFGFGCEELPAASPLLGKFNDFLGKNFSKLSIAAAKVADASTKEYFRIITDCFKVQAVSDDMKSIMEKVLENYPNSKAIFEVHEQYRNMKEVVDLDPRISSFAVKAIEKAGIPVQLTRARGGTDGSRLSFMGLPCPNLFTGEMAFHGKHEYVSVQDMEKSSEVLVHLCAMWAQ